MAFRYTFAKMLLKSILAWSARGVASTSSASGSRTARSRRTTDRKPRRFRRGRRAVDISDFATFRDETASMVEQRSSQRNRTLKGGTIDFGVGTFDCTV